MTRFFTLNQTLRSLRRDRGFTIVVVATLALGIGGNAALLGVVKATFFSHLPFSESARVMRLLASYRNPDGSLSQVTVHGREFNILNQNVTRPGGPFSSLVGLEDVSATLTGVDAPEKLTMIHSTPGWKLTLGIEPVLGRWFTSEEERAGQDSGVAVIAFSLWQQRFGGSSSVLNQTITLDGRTYTIVGVLPTGFRFPYDGEIWVPVTTPPDMTHDYAVFGRLNPGFSRTSAQAALDSAAAAVRKQFPDTAPGFGFSQISLLQNLQDNEQGTAKALLGITSFFLLLACINVANLMITRAVARQREEAIRVALGASRWDQIRRKLFEGMLLSLFGTTAGIGLAMIAGRWLDALVPSNFVKQFGIHANPVDASVLIAAAILGLAGGVIIGVLPALESTKDDGRALVQGNLRSGRSRGERRTMNAFVVLQFTLALALIAGAGLMIQNFNRLTHRSLGIDATRLLSMQISVPAPLAAATEKKIALVRDLVREVEATPGVSAAGVSSINPLGPGSWWAPVALAGREEQSTGTSTLVNHRLVTPDFFRAMGIPLKRGRFFTDQDQQDSMPVVIVSDRMAKKFWPGQDAINRRIRIDRAGSRWLTVVGVVGDVQDFGGPGAPHETWYLPYAQFADTPAAANINLMVRSNLAPLSIQAGVEQAVHRVSESLAVSNVSTMDQFYLASLSQNRLSSILVSVLAAFGLLLGTLGIYGTLSFAVGVRVKEIGIRIALGAKRQDIFRLTLFEAMRLCVISTVFGICAAWAVGRVLASQLSQVSPSDPRTLASAAAILAATALLAAYVPARRAAHVDPLVALRDE